jgi:hypothetical protein
MASKRDQENWQEDRLVIFLSTDRIALRLTLQIVLPVFTPSGVPVAFPIEQRYSPVGKQHVFRIGQKTDTAGIQIAESGRAGLGTDRRCCRARFFEVKAEDLA